MPKIIPVALARAAAPTATTNSTPVDLSDYTGNGKVVLDAAQPAAGQTLDVRLQHSDTLGGSYTDVGVAFTQVTNAGGASYQVRDVSADQFKRFVRCVSTIAGAATALPHQVTFVGGRAL